MGERISNGGPSVEVLFWHLHGFLIVEVINQLAILRQEIEGIEDHDTLQTTTPSVLLYA